MQPSTTCDSDSTRGDWASGLEVWSVETVGHSILLFLDILSLESVLQIIQTTSSLFEYLQDSALWNELLHLHVGGEQAAELRFLELSVRDRGWDWTYRDRSCDQLQAFLQSADGRNHFDKVVAKEGDIGWIEGIDGMSLDGIVLPTNSYGTDHQVGDASVVFRWAGQDLRGFVTAVVGRSALWAKACV